MTYLPLKDCIPGRVYRIKARNFTLGVFDGREGFIGIREKFGHRYLFTEDHWDTGAPHGTVQPIEDIGIFVSSEIVLAEYADGAHNEVLFAFLEKLA